MDYYTKYFDAIYGVEKEVFLIIEINKKWLIV